MKILNIQITMERRLRFKFFFLLFFVILGEGAETNEKSFNRFESLQGSDSIQVARCDLVCFNKKDKKEVS